MNRLALAALILAISVAPAAALAAPNPIGFTAMGGLYSGNVDEPFLGAGLRVGLGGLSVTPYGEYIFVDGGSYYTVNADATFPIVPLGVASLYGGGGAGLHIVDPDGGESDTETGVNLLLGAGFNAAPMKPYGQVKYTFLEGDDPIVFTAGVRF